jgi:hypothetical protein
MEINIKKIITNNEKYLIVGDGIKRVIIMFADLYKPIFIYLFIRLNILD